MKFTRAIVVGYKEKYFCFSGRASRSEYNYFNIFNMLIYFLFVLFLPFFLPLDSEHLNTALYLIMLPLLSPMFGIAVRRVHDLNCPGWWYLTFSVLTFIPSFVEVPSYIFYVSGILSIIVLILLIFLKGTKGENKFGLIPE